MFQVDCSEDVGKQTSIDSDSEARELASIIWRGKGLVFYTLQKAPAVS